MHCKQEQGLSRCTFALHFAASGAASLFHKSVWMSHPRSSVRSPGMILAMMPARHQQFTVMRHCCLGCVGENLFNKSGILSQGSRGD